MSTTHRLSSRRPRAGRAGFTLIELLIVGALIALFAGLAIFGAQQAYLNNQRKAVIGESRQVATALDFAYGDVGFFPLLCFMDDSLEGLRQQSQLEFGNQDGIFNIMQIYSIPTVQKLTNIRANWKGPYFAPAQARSQVSQGRGGSAPMRINIGGTNLDEVYPWPADSYGNPYMVYLLNIDVDSGAVYFANRTDETAGAGFEVDPTVLGNYVNAVVSYGRNRVPGGGDTVPSTAAVEAMRLYVGRIQNPNDDPSGANPIRTLEPNEYTPARAGAWSDSLAVGGTAFIENNEGTDLTVGITDPGSDDIVFTF